jgi:hypothetical protein
LSRILLWVDTVEKLRSGHEDDKLIREAAEPRKEQPGETLSDSDTVARCQWQEFFNGILDLCTRAIRSVELSEDLLNYRYRAAKGSV